jgi:hypothetical protein
MLPPIIALSEEPHFKNHQLVEIKITIHIYSKVPKEINSNTSFTTKSKN